LQAQLAAHGLGIAWCREALVNELKTPFIKTPAAAGSAQAKAHAVSQFDYMRIAHRFEGGNPNFLGVKVLKRGAEFIESIGIPAIEARVRELTTKCIEMLTSKRPPDADAGELGRARANRERDCSRRGSLMTALREKHRVVTNVKDGSPRLSMSFFNNEEDIERTVDAIVTETRGASAAAA
jgi:selenocysteine lyase/cysteine desulfurase